MVVAYPFDLHEATVAWGAPQVVCIRNSRVVLGSSELSCAGGEAANVDVAVSLYLFQSRVEGKFCKGFPRNVGTRGTQPTPPLPPLSLPRQAPKWSRSPLVRGNLWEEEQQLEKGVVEAARGTA